MSGIKGYLKGFRLPFQSIKTTFSTPSLYAPIAIPLLMNIILFVGGFVALWMNRVQVIEWIWAMPESAWLSVFWYAFAVILFLIVMVLVYFLFTPIGCLLASPFNDFLSKKAEAIFDEENKGEEAKLSFLGLLNILKKEVIKVFAMGVVVLFAFLFNLIPVIGSVVSLGLLASVGAVVLCFEYLDYPMSRYDYSTKEIFTTINSNLAYTAGFGLGAWLMLMIPFLNLLSIPVLVVAATKAFTELRQASLLPVASKSKRR